KSLLAAYAAGRNEVGLEEAKAAIGDCDFSDAAPPPPVRRIRHAVAAGLGALSLALFAFWLRTEPPENAAAQATAPTAQAAPASATALPAPAAAPPAPPLAAPPVSLTEQRLAAGRAWLQQAEDEHWFIQLRAMNADQTAQIEAFLQKLEKLLPVDQTRAYLGKRGDTPRIGIVFGEYANQTQAMRALTALPPEVLSGQPYLRQVRKLR